MAQGIDAAGSSLGDMLKQRKEEEKQIKSKADIARFIAKKDPTIFGNSFDPQGISDRELASWFDGVRQSAEIGQNVAYTQQINLQKQKFDQETSDANSWNGISIKPDVNDPNYGFDRKGTPYRKTPTGWVQVGDLPNFINSTGYAQDRGLNLGQIINGQQQQPMGQSQPQDIGMVAQNIVGQEKGNALAPFLERNMAAKQDEQQAAKEKYGALGLYLSSLSSKGRSEYENDNKKFIKGAKELSKLALKGSPEKLVGKQKELQSLYQKHGGVIGVSDKERAMAEDLFKTPTAGKQTKKSAGVPKYTVEE